MSGIVKPLPGAQLNTSHPLAQGLVGCWLMNEGSGKNVHDYSGQNNEGTISGMNDPPISTSGWNAGPHGGALAFNGSDDYVDCGNAPILKELTTQLTVVYNFILYAYPIANYTAVICKGYPPSRVQGGSWLPGITTTGSGYFFLRNGDNTNYSYPDGLGWPQIPLNTPMSMAHVFDGPRTYAATYQNGKVTGEKSDIGFSSIYASTINIEIGRRPLSWYLNGLISSASIYNRALSAEEIAYLYAYPYCMFDDAGWEAWMARTQNRNFEHYYRRLMAA